MTPEEYLTKAELMIEKPCMYGLDEYPDVIVEVSMLGEQQLADELLEAHISEMKKRDKDPEEEYSLLY